MTTLSRSALVAYEPQEMYALVNDIEHYPEFLPWCRSTQVHARSDDEVRATIEIAKGSVRKSFTTRNHMQTGKMIEVGLVDGPFSHLHGFWRFDRLGDTACKVSLDMEFDFSNRLLGLAIGPVFSQIVISLVDAFVKRARDVYGPR
ncbi:type II toxin-antitoxin system RatA family toxin [Acidihalobacter ferrooxydans]|uniref:Ubiquinone-binding protein n=1 Tax=Acidihalobacter ferrooxydans TaxID=1765967 RepID=A0A1P8UEF1_9GAMM|nr:type II toxin-antitoxin system RatA family toxin [Acidihalobacter ferrooxydans]APZ42227.1 ubiquinone-binding protein [Acidihalobacter ferrooxydans]